MLGKMVRRMARPMPIAALRERARALTPGRTTSLPFTSWAQLPLAPEVRAEVEAARKGSPEAELLLGTIDDDGRVLWRFGPLPGLPSVSDAQFVDRRRFGLSIILCKDSLLICKDYRGDHETFVREWAALTHLAGKVNVPAVHHVNESRTLLYRNLILNKTIRELLVTSGATILNADTSSDASLKTLNQKERTEAVWTRGRDLLPKIVDEEFLQRLEEQLEAAHREGVVGISITWGNVVVEEATNTPWLIDLDKARILQSRDSISFQLLRDDERVLFNQVYNRHLITESTAREALASHGLKMGGWYAPIDFGKGLTTAGFWSTDNGTGRWAYLNKPVLKELLAGKRILDLGSNNGIMPMMMLRDGAKEVLGVELSPENVECAQFVRRVFEWRDGQRYQLQMHRGNMLDVLRCDWGRFDIITAFCSLYYLEPDEMAAVVRKAAELAPVMILQAKTDTRKTATENKAQKSSLPFLKNMLEKNGFPHVEVVAPKQFTRPLLIARTSSNGTSMAARTWNMTGTPAGHAKVDTASVKSTFLIATSWQSGPVSQQFRALGAELVSRRHNVVLLIDRHNRAVENYTTNPAVFIWPSFRPTRLQDARFLSHLIRHRRPDCLVSNFGSVNVMTLTGWCHRVKARVAWHHTLSSQTDVDTPHPPWKLRLLRWRKRWVWRFATAIATVSGAAKQDLHNRFHVPNEKCQVIYNSLADPLNGGAYIKKLSGENRIVCVGRFHRSKGQDVLLRAAGLLALQIPKLKIQFLGDGPLRGECERIAAELNLTDSCNFEGSVPHSKVLEAMQVADVVVVPSRNEAFGLVALESIALGTPVVASAVGGLVEILTEGLQQLLVPPNDPKTLADKLHQLLTHSSEHYAALSAQSRLRFLQEFEQSAAVRRQADWLESLLPPGKPK
jgi:glycosyltransferase involved in cell wall biosynthesis/2-polyprenyl-3-methyl-5-hydroxy-6-metoxy-1,4-benzoquinol methylase